MANGIKYQAHEILNKVLNSAETGLQVDIVAGAEYAEDAAHTSADTGNFILGVRNDTLAALGGTDGDYVPFQMNSSGALFVDIADGGQLDTIIDTLETTLTAIETDAAAIEVLLTAANVDHAANEVLLTGIDADTNAIKVDMAAIEVLLTGIDADTDAIKTAVQILDDWDDSNYANVNINLAGSDAPTGGGAESGALRVTIANDSTGVVSVDDGGGALTVDGTVTANLSATDNAVLDTIDATLDNMLYGTALAVTAVHGGSDHALGATYEAFHIGVGGDISLDCATSGTNIVFKNLASGQMLPVRATVVNATNTTATNIVALKA